MFKAIGRLFQRVKEGLSKTRQVIGGALRKLIGAERRIDAAFLQELEDTLLSADIGVAKTDEIIAELKTKYTDGTIAKGEDLLAFLKASLRSELAAADQELRYQASGPTVVLIVGVNGAGKTTTIAKLAHRLTGQGRKVLVAAGDTYRAAAIEQLTIWATRAGVEIVKGEAGGDAAAIAFDAIAAAQARGSTTRTT
jgi:fused signal recognition particle receptor